ncbi:MAG: roadblock/LC7 domain-containing protein [Anaerolineae bacterium]|nr:roadblock/LC7 domain-containing protein [Anaerolineae bacterium]
MPESRAGSERATPTSFADVVEDMYRTGDYRAIVLASADGLPIAAAPSDYESDLPSAMAALIRGVSRDVQAQLGMAELDEVTIYDRTQQRLVSRYITAGNESLILAVAVSPGRPYRRSTNRAIRQIERLLA